MASSTDEIPYHMRDDTHHNEEMDEVIPPPPTDASVSSSSSSSIVDVTTTEATPAIDYTTYKTVGEGLASSAKISQDGRIIVSLDLKQRLPDLPKEYAQSIREYAVDPSTTAETPALNIVIMIVGSRGDVQPYIVLANGLKKHGHRVRLASHETFRQMVTGAGHEFYPIGGDPAELMSFMVKNPGLLPGWESLTNGDIPRKRKMIGEILDGCWKACYEKDPQNGPFAADAIISNPPTFAHIHCAEALGIPVHLSFTMPWCPTTAFPHPLVGIKASNAEKGLTNYLSYAIADLFQWQGLGDIINRFRVKTLGLQPLSLRSGPSLIDRLKIPWTYCFSPALIPRPRDWMNNIDVVGFYFLKAAAGYEADPALLEFISAGEPPIYIGFGSVVVEDSKAMTKTIFDAVAQANVRAIVSAGWGGLGDQHVPSNIFVLPGHPSVPHDWLFTKVFAVCHHGGAGTTAIGLLLGKPTIVVPFFGDQPFWGQMIHKAGAGPEPIPQRALTAEVLASGIKYCQTPAAQSAAHHLAEQIRNEDGEAAGVESFHAHLPLLKMRCDLDPSRVAVWWSQEYLLKLSALTASILSEAKVLPLDKLDIYRTKEYDTRRKVSDPVTGGVSAIFWTATHMLDGLTQLFYKPKKEIINSTTAIPLGFFRMVDYVHEGLQNLPVLYGSDIRRGGQVLDFPTGLKEGGKELFYGLYDGITGLVTEPMKGAQKEGWKGGLKGAARGWSSALVKPAAGSMGLVVHPVRGLWKNMQRKWAKKQSSDLRQTRAFQGTEALGNCSDISRTREEILQAFGEAKKTVKERRDVLKAEYHAFIESGGGLSLEHDVTIDPKQSSSAHASSSQSQTSESGAKIRRVHSSDDIDGATAHVDSALASHLPLVDDKLAEVQHPPLQ